MKWYSKLGKLFIIFSVLIDSHCNLKMSKTFKTYIYPVFCTVEDYHSSMKAYDLKAYDLLKWSDLKKNMWFKSWRFQFRYFIWLLLSYYVLDGHLHWTEMISITLCSRQSTKPKLLLPIKGEEVWNKGGVLDTVSKLLLEELMTSPNHQTMPTTPILNHVI